MTGVEQPNWRALESQIGEFFAANGYVTELNVIREGRSGGRHEMDVFAVKSDGIADFTVMIECKAWNSPIEKDIVSKADYVVRDLGLNKAIIVSLAGWRAGAETAARELGIDLWDAVELEKRLGKATVARLTGATGVRTGATRRVVAPSPLLSAADAEQHLWKKRAGLLGREELVWAQLAWAPFYVVDIQISQAERRLLGAARVKSRSIRNVHNGFSGGFYVPHEEHYELEDVDAEALIPARVTERKVGADIAKTCGHLASLSSPSARERQAAKIKAIGIPLPFTSVEVDGIAPIAWPYYIGLMRRGNSERLVAVDAVRQSVSEYMTTILTQHHPFVLDALGRRDRVT
ncbi:MAG: restriction endonuclease [Gaiella sp.]